jgi:hypothetical protein
MYRVSSSSVKAMFMISDLETRTNRNRKRFFFIYLKHFSRSPQPGTESTRRVIKTQAENRLIKHSADQMCFVYTSTAAFRFFFWGYDTQTHPHTQTYMLTD